LGLLLIATGLVSLLAVWGLTSGAILTPASAVLTAWLGWGSFLLISALLYVGASLVRRQLERIPWGRVFALEVASLLALGILSALGGNSLVRADAGMDGGRLGWGIAYLAEQYLGVLGGRTLLVLSFLLCVGAGLGAWAAAERKIRDLAGAGSGEHDASMEPSPAKNHSAAVPAKSSGRKSRGSIPGAIRPSLISGEAGAAKPGKLPPRSEGLPPLSLLIAEESAPVDERTINQTAGLVVKTLAEFGIPATVMGYRVGPAVTQFAVQPGFIKRPGAAEDEDAQQMKVRVAQIANLQRDLALALSAERLRIEAPVPGKAFVGIEVPNARSSIVRLKPILESEAFRRGGGPLTVALGRDVSGHPTVGDLSQMPHLLIAGATGSGKSVCITSIAACLAMNNSPDDLRMIMIDSKMVRWVVMEMERRYRILESGRSRDLDAHNRKQSRKKGGTPLPRIVILIDELADLMMSSPDQTEHNLVRLAQMARATGIHLVVATQRPSTDVVTGVIKANFPARLAFAVTSSVDSRVILDTGGAQNLLGRGDMLFLNPELGNTVRAQGVMVTDNEIERVIGYWQKHTEEAVEATPPWETLLEEADEDADEGLMQKAISVVRSSGRASASLLQRRLRIGYPRAARLLDQLEAQGIVGPSLGGGKEREILPNGQGQETDS
jgi:S-DNA-T family DNA segregation ATPase FtsK/SpoIIIE